MVSLLVASVVTGFAGLAFEVVCLRRTALLVGWGSTGQGLVLGAFLFGLGLGSWLVPRVSRLAARPLRSAALSYAMVAVVLPLGLALLEAVGPRDALVAHAASFGVPFGAAFLMGGAFPLLFPAVTGALGGRGAGFLQAANLSGSVLGASVGALVLVPGLGFRPAVGIAAGGYLLAGLLVASGKRWGGRAGTRACSERERERVPRETGSGPWVVAASGFAVLGLELWMPRRLTFFLGGFLPTLAGTLVAVLLGLALGSLVAERLARRGTRAIGWVAFVAVLGVAVAVSLVEWLGPVVATWRLTGTWQAFGVATAVPFFLVLPATVPLGVVLPLVLDRMAGTGGLPARDAGLGFLAFSLGALVASVGLPFAFALPEALRAVPLLAALPLALCAGRVLQAVAGVAALGAVLVPFWGRPALVGARHWPLGQVRKQLLHERADRITTASVVRDRVTGEKLLYTDEFSAAGGISSSYMRALGMLPGWGAPDGGRLVCLCLGTGTTAAALSRARGAIDIVEISPAVVALSRHFDEEWQAWSDGARVHLADGRHWLALQPDRSIAALTLEPLLPQAPGSVHLYSRAFYREVRRVLMADGICVQWLPAHALRPESYQSLLRTFLDAFASVRAYLLDNSTVLVGSEHVVGARWYATEPKRAAGVPFRAFARQAYLDPYLCGLWGDDLLVTELDVAAASSRLADAPLVVDDRPFLETAVHASGREIVGWLPDNLGLWESDAPGDDLATARRFRLSGKRLLAGRLLRPRDTLQTAEESLRVARLRQPRSVLLWREHRHLRALRAQTDAFASLGVREWLPALDAFDRALQLDHASPLVLAGRIAAYSHLDKARAEAALDDLEAFLPGFRALPELQALKGGSLRPLYEGDLARRTRATPAAAGTWAEFPDAWQRNEAWARHRFRRQPYRARFELCVAMVEGFDPGSRAGDLLAGLDLAGLEMLEAWVAPGGRFDPLRLEAMARLVARDVPLPHWWQELGERFEQARRRFDAGDALPAWRDLHEHLGLVEPRPLPDDRAGRLVTLEAMRRRFVPAR